MSAFSVVSVPDQAQTVSCVADLTCTFVAWLKDVDPSQQELISVFILRNIERSSSGHRDTYAYVLHATARVGIACCWKR